MLAQARTARPTIVLNGSDYFSKLAPYFLSLIYTDNCDGVKADDLQLMLADRDNRFISDWMPDKGTFIEVSIIAERWFAPLASALSLDCGRFWIDEIEFQLPQHTVSIKGCSIPTDAHIKASKNTRGWEDTTLQDIANQIAKENKMTVDWQADYNPRYDRVEQVSQSSLAFLQERADDAKLAIKVHRGKIIVFDEQQFEDAGPRFTIVYGNKVGSGEYQMKGGKFVTRLTDTMKTAQVSHTSVELGELIKGDYSAPDEDLEGSHTNHINENVDSADDIGASNGDGGGGTDIPTDEGGGLIGGLEGGSGGSTASDRKARAEVRKANRHKEQGTIAMSIGNPLIAAGQTFTLKGVGKYDGKWFIESALHEVGPMYTTTLGVRRCLKGY
jgi:Bacteriophage probable baseplate hub protein